MRQIVYEILAGGPGPREGRLWSTRSYRSAFETAVTEAGLDITLYGLRHHWASWFMMRGGSLLALSKILGHGRITMTEKYAHLSPDHLRDEITRTEAGARMPAHG